MKPYVKRGKTDAADAEAICDSPAPGQRHPIRAVLSRSAFPTTLTEDSAIAAAAITGKSRMPNNG